ncbi:MAG: twin-arginine translocase TatA/TatE family subunit [Acidimicrobiales bacterium]
MVAEILSEWGIIVVVLAIVFLFGATKLPKFARSLGSAQAEFKKGAAEGSKPDDAPADSAGAGGTAAKD